MPRYLVIAVYFVLWYNNIIVVTNYRKLLIKNKKEAFLSE